MGAVHFNSIQAYHEGLDALNKRSKAIYCHMLGQHPATDREIADAMGFSHKSAVQPRISELVDQGWLQECGSRNDPVTGKRVRTVRATQASEVLIGAQMEMAL